MQNNYLKTFCHDLSALLFLFKPVNQCYDGSIISWRYKYVAFIHSPYSAVKSICTKPQNVSLQWPDPNLCTSMPSVVVLSSAQDVCLYSRLGLCNLFMSLNRPVVTATLSCPLYIVPNPRSGYATARLVGQTSSD